MVASLATQAPRNKTQSQGTTSVVDTWGGRAAASLFSSKPCPEKNHLIQDSYESKLVSFPSHCSTFRPRAPCFCFALWPLLLHCFIVFRDRRSVRLQQLLVCSLPAYSSLTPSLLCQHFLLVLLSTLRQDFVLLTHSGASPLRQKPTHVENVNPRDLLNFNCESVATSWLAASRSSCSSNSLPRTGLYADVTLNCCSNLFMWAGSVDFLAVLLSDCGFSVVGSSS